MNKKDSIPALPGFGPVAPLERIETIDILRGFALLCILIVNWTVNSKWDTSYWAGFSDTANVIAYYTFNILLDEKSWPMFTFLFGLGFAIQMQRAESRDSRFIAVYSRRLVILFLIGAAHDILTERDILYNYAIVGFLLLPVRKLNLRLLIVLSLLCITGVFTYSAVNVYNNQKRIAMINNAKIEIPVDSTLLDSYVGVYETPEQHTAFMMRKKNELFIQPNGYKPSRLLAESTTKFFKKYTGLQISFVKDSMGTMNGFLIKGIPFRKIQSGQPVIDDKTLRLAASKEKVYKAYANGSFGEIVSMRAREFWEKITSWTSYISWLTYTFPLFLLGLYAGRRRIFHDVSNNRKFIKKIMWWGLLFGFAAWVVKSLWGEWFREHSFLFWFQAFWKLIYWLGGPALGLGYLAGLTLLLQRQVWKKKLAPLASVGQMALTNYLLQSVVYVLLFFGYGLGWYGKFGAFGGLLLSVSLFALQIVASRWWLRHFRFGPFEWLWRSLTYWKKQPMLKK